MPQGTPFLLAPAVGVETRTAIFRLDCADVKSPGRRFIGILKAKMRWCSLTWKIAIELFGTIFLIQRPRRICAALIKFEQMANWPEIIDCPFLRIASEYPDPAHPYHRLAIKHQSKIFDYLTDLLKPLARDRRAAAAAILGIIDGAFSLRMLYGNTKEVAILPAAEAILKNFQCRR